MLFNNIDETSPQSINSQNFNPSNDAFDAMAADDFVVPVSETWTITRSVVRGTQDRTTPATAADVKFFADKAELQGRDPHRRGGGDRLPADEPGVRRTSPHRGDLLVRSLRDPRPRHERSIQPVVLV